MKNKGFTLVELLATIVIIALIGGIGALTYTAIIRNSENSVFEAYENTMHAEVIQLLAQKVHLIPKTETTFYLNDLLYTYEAIDPINNPKNKNDLCTTRSYVKVTREITSTGLDSFTYKVCLICNDYNTDESKCKTFDN